MSRKLSIGVSVALILIGVVSLMFTFVGAVFGFRVWQLWPLIVIAAGLAFVLPPLLVRGRRGLGGLFILGVPVLTNGMILLFTSVTGWWGAWEWLWPLEVTGVALGFLFAAIKMRVIWLLIPTIIIGANGFLLQLCAITGWWAVWAVAWAIEPLSVGLALLAVNLKQHSAGLTVAGIAVCALAVVGAIESLAIVAMAVIFPVWWLWKFVAPVTLILVGIGLLVWGVIRRVPTIPLATN
ncbi:MAG: hypothetical protein AB8I69_11045 [Anaerolineae bacterium]|jgi:hypothetical protein